MNTKNTVDDPRDAPPSSSSQAWSSGIDYLRRFIRHRALLSAFLVSVAYAFYTGFRAPNLWSSHYYQVSYLDGIYRRAFLGTILTPLGCARFDYFFIQKIQFVVLALVVLFIVYIVVKTREFITLSLFFLSAAGGYLFHEVGYIDQFLWLVAALGIFAIERGRTALAAAFLCAAVMAHEMAIFTALPLVLAYVVIRKRPPVTEYLELFAAPITLFALIFLKFQVVPQSTLHAYSVHATSCGHPVLSASYFYAFKNRFTGERMGVYYKNKDFLVDIIPTAILAYVLTVSIRIKAGLSPLMSALILLICISPLFLGLFGWDTNRWIFLAFAQTVLVGLIASWYIRKSDPGYSLLLTPFGVALVLVAIQMQLSYLDGFDPRTLSLAHLQSFATYAVGQVHTLPIR